MTEEKKKPKVHDFWLPHEPVKLDTGSETIVEQCHEETTNINKIIGRYRRGQPLPQNEDAQYGDVSNVGELMDIKLMQNQLIENYENLPDFIKEKMPLADIGNVTDESLQEIFHDRIKGNKKADQGNSKKASQEAGANNQGNAARGEPKETPASDT